MEKSAFSQGILGWYGHIKMSFYFLAVVGGSYLYKQ